MNLHRVLPLWVCVSLFAACSSQPGPAVIAIAPADPYPNEGLKLEIVTPADFAGSPLKVDPANYDIIWSVGADTSINATLGDVFVIPSPELDAGEIWTVVVTPRGHNDSTGPSSTASVTINTPPTSSVQFETPPATRADNLVLRIETEDTDLADRAHIGVSVDWEFQNEDNEESTPFLNATTELENTEEGSSTPQIRTSTIPQARLEVGQTWTATVTTETTSLNAERRTESESTGTIEITIENSPPSITSAQITLETDNNGNGTPEVGDVLKCEPDGWTDAEDDSEGYTWRWLKQDENGTFVPVQLATTDTFEDFVGGDHVKCEATPFDGTEPGTEKTSSAETIENTAPVITDVIVTTTTNEDGDGNDATAIATDTLQCAGSYSDADGDPDNSTYEWTNASSTVLGTSQTLSGSFARDETITCTLTPNDGSKDGTPSSSSITIDNATPSATGAEITAAPSPATLASTLTCELLGLDDPDDADEPSATCSWSVENTSGTTTINSASCELAAAFQRDDTVSCEATPTDSTAFGGSHSDLISIGNTPPTLTSVTLVDKATGSASAYTDSTLKAVVSEDDADGDTVEFIYAWEVNGTPVSGESSKTLDSSHFERDNTVTVTVIPEDDKDSGTSQSATITILNSKPQWRNDVDCFAVAPADNAPEPYTEGDSVEALYAGDTPVCVWDPACFEDADSDTPQTTTQITIDGAEGLRPYDQVSAGYNHTCGIDQEETLLCWGDDSEGQSTPPSGTYTHISAGNHFTCAIDTDDQLTCWGLANGTDSSGASFALVSGVPSGTFIDVSSGNSHVAAIRTDGTIECWGNPDDNRCTNIPTGAFKQVTSGDTHSCAITDDDAVKCWGLNTQTQANNQSGVFTDVVAVANTSCALTDTGAIECWGEANQALIDDRPMATSFVALEAGTQHICAVKDTNSLKCWGSDLHGLLTDTPSDRIYDQVTSGANHTCAIDTNNYASCWGDNAAGQGHVPLRNIVKGDTISCIYTPFDGQESGTSLSDYTTVKNTAPQLTEVTITNATDADGDGNAETAAAEDTLECSWTVEDIDETDPENISVVWTDGDGTTLGTKETLSGVFVHEDIITCTVTPNDGTTDGAPGTKEVTIGNTLPTVADVTITSTTDKDGDGNSDTAITADSLLCTWTFEDVDGESDHSTVEWTNSNGDSLGTGPTLSSGFVHLDVITCTVTPNDGTDPGEAQTSTLTIGNALPTVSAVTVLSATDADGDGDNTTAISTDDLFCSWTFEDADGESDSSTLQWTNDIGAVLGTSATLSGSFARGELITCTVTPNDGTDPGSPGSGSITIDNAVPEADSAEIQASPDPADASSTLSCQLVGATDSDSADVVTPTCTWTIDSGLGPVDPGVTDCDLAGVFGRDDVIQCTASPTDGTDTGSPRTSASVIIGNTPPTVTSVNITPSPATQGQPLTCDYTLDDADGDSIEAEISWTVNGVDIPSFVEIAVGESHACVLAASGEVNCWGTDTSGQGSPPSDLFSTIDAESDLTCGVTVSGTVQCWGDDGYDRVTEVPTSNDFVSVNVGSRTVCGVTTTNEAVCWGDDHSGQAIPLNGTYHRVTTNTHVSCGVTTQGDGRCWGSNGYGQLDIPSVGFQSIDVAHYHACGITDTGAPTCWGEDYNNAINDTPTSGTFVQITGGQYHNCAIADDSSLQCWGRDSDGQSSPPVTGASYIDVNAGYSTTCALTTEGEVVCWGDDSGGIVSDAPSTLTAVVFGDYHACALDNGGRVNCWGGDTYNQVTDTPTGTDFTQLETGWDFTCGLDRLGDVTCWGRDDDLVVTNAPTDPDYVQLTGGWFHSCALNASGAVTCWGDDSMDKIGDTPTGTNFTQVTAGSHTNCAIDDLNAITCWGDDLDDIVTSTPSDTDFVDVGLGFSHACGLHSDGHITCWGANTNGQVTDTPTSTGFTELETGYDGACAIDGTGSIQCWGDDTQEQVTGTPTEPGYTQIAKGDRFNCALTDQGTISCWGWWSAPASWDAPIGGGYTELFPGRDQTCALHQDGTLSCWGDDTDNQVSLAPSPPPTITLTNTLAAGFSAGDQIDCTVTPSDGSDVGLDTSGPVLNVNSLPDCTVDGVRPDNGVNGDPITVATDAICETTCPDPDADGDPVTTSYAWTVNGSPVGTDSDQLAATEYTGGDELRCTVSFSDPYESFVDSVGLTITNTLPTVSGVTVSPDPPTTTDVLTCDYTLDDADSGDTPTAEIEWTVDGTEVGDFVQVSSSGDHTCALSTSGAAVCWGDNTYGESTPLAETFVNVSAGGNHACGVTTAGEVKCWGADEVSQSTPTAETFVNVSAGGNHACGLTTTGEVRCWGEDGFNQVTNTPTGSFVHVSAGSEYTCGITTTDEVACWGSEAGGKSTPPAGSFTSVSAGEQHTCGVTTTGDVQCWGSNTHGQSNTPTGSFISLSAGKYHTCGITTTDEVSCWGSDSKGQKSSPTGSFVSVSAGSYHTCGQTTAGDVVCWGIDDGSSEDYGQVADAPRRYTKVGTGERHSCALTEVGGIECWGTDSGSTEAQDYDWGQVTNTPTDIGYTTLVVGGYHNCALDSAGQVACWGADTDRSGAWTYNQVSGAPTASGHTALYTSFYGSCAVDASDLLVCWGRNGDGQASEAPTDASAYVSIAPGEYHGCAVTVGGAIECWGADDGLDNDWGQVTDAPSGTDYTKVVSAKRHSCALTATGSIDCWGITTGAASNPDYHYGQVTDAPNNNGYTDLWAGAYTSCAADPTGAWTCWGRDDHGQFTNGPSGIGYSSLSFSWGFGCAISTTDTVECWGYDGTLYDYGQVTDTPTPAPIPELTDTLVGGFDAADLVECSVTPVDGTDAGIAEVAEVTVNTPPSGYISSIRPESGTAGDPVTVADSAKCETGDTYGDANGDSVTLSFAWTVNGVSAGSAWETLEPSNFTAGDLLSCAVTFDDGLDTTVDSLSISVTNSPPTVASVSVIPDPPTASDVLTCDYALDDADGDTPTGEVSWSINGSPAPHFTTVANGENHSCALTPSGEASCWGLDDDGQVSDIPSGVVFTQLTAGKFHTCGLTTAGAVECWGIDTGDEFTNNYGQVTLTPTDSFTAVSAGDYHSCGIKTDGAVECWGWNGHGQTNYPTGTFASINAGSTHSCGIKTDGTVACWGSNPQGETTAPTGTFASVSAGTWYSCGVTTSGTVECWGYNTYGQHVAPSGSFTSVSTGGTVACGITTGGTVDCWGHDNHGQATPPAGTFTSVSAGDWHGCGVTTDGDVLCWGVDDGSSEDYGQVTSAPRRFTTTGAGSRHSCALDGFGAIECWGITTGVSDAPDLDYGQVTDTPTDSGYTVLAVGGQHNCALDGLGAIECWGVDDGSLYDYGQVTDTPTDSGYTALFAGWKFNCAGDAAGTLHCWGNDEHGQVGQAPIDATTYDSFDLGGLYHGCGLTVSGGVSCWGIDDYSQYDYGQVTDAPAGTGYTKVVSGYHHSCALTTAGTIECWGVTTGEDLSPVLDGGQVTNAPTGNGYTDLWGGANSNCAANVTGDLTCWGYNRDNVVAAAPSGPGYTGVSMSFFHMCALTTSGGLECWGIDDGHSYDYGQVTSAPVTAPIPPLTDTLIGGFGVGDDVECSVTPTDGTDVGTADITTATVNTPSDGIVSWIMPATGFSGDPITAAADAFCLAAFSDPDVDGDAVTVSYAWSVNGITQGSDSPTLASSNFAAGETLVCTATFDDGHESVLDSASVIVQNATPTVTNVGIIPDPPTANDALTCDYTLDDADGDATSAEVQWIVNGVDVSGFVKVRTHLWVSCALDLSGEITCWGDTGSSAIENATAGSFRDFSIGDYSNDPFICALPTTADSGVVCWGNDEQNQVTDAPFTGDYVQIDAGYGVACGRLDNGSVTCWGWNPGWETYPRVGPYIDVSAGNRGICGILADGDLDCWGDASQSYGIVTNRPTTGPYVDVNVNEFHGCVLDAAGEITCWAGSGASSLVSHTPPTGPFVGFDHGVYNGCAWDSSGALTCWGVTSYGVETPPSVDLHSVNLGYSHACGLDDAGVPVCWGQDDDTEVLGAPASLVTVDASDDTSCGVTAQGRIRCWGSEGGQYLVISNAPEGNTWADVQLARDHACALDGGGLIQCWGRTDTSDGAPTGAGHVAFTLGGYSNCAIDSGGTITCWGIDGVYDAISGAPINSGYHFLGSGNKFHCAGDINGVLTCWGEDDHNQVSEAPTGTGYTQVAGGNAHACALDTAGQINCWGDDTNGQTTGGPSDSGYTSIAADYYTSCAIDSSGQVNCWGEYGTEFEAAFDPAKVYLAIEIGEDHICGIDERGNVECWGETLLSGSAPVPMPIGGDSLVGGFGPGDTVECEVTPTDGSNTGSVTTGSGTINTPPTATNMDLGSLYASTTSVTCAYTYTDADSDIESGTTFSWSKNGALEGSTSATWSGSLVIGDTLMCMVTPHDGIESGSPTTISGTVANEPPTISVTVTPDPPASIDALTCTATVTDNDVGDSAMPNFEWSVNGSPVEGLYAVSMSMNTGEHACALNASGAILCWGDNSYGQVSDTPMTDGYIQALAVDDTSCAVHSSGSFDCWGRDQWGQLLYAPDDVSVTSIHGSQGDTLCAITETETIECWGNNNKKEVSEVPTTSGFVEVAVSSGVACAIDQSGSLTCWGDNLSTPTWDYPVPTGSGYISVKLDPINGYFGCALDNTGALDCFGLNSVNQVSGKPADIYIDFGIADDATCGLTTSGLIHCWGDNTRALVNNAPPDSDFVTLQVGALHACALDTAGELTCWGTTSSSSDGQVTQTPSGSGFSSLAAGQTGNCATDSTGELRCWGSPTNHSSAAWSSLSVQTQTSCALSSEGAIYCWGWDNYAIVSDRPTNSGYIAVETGYYTGCALDLLGQLTCWGDDSFNQLTNMPSGQDFVQVSGGEDLWCARDDQGYLICWGHDSDGQASTAPTGSGYLTVQADYDVACALDSAGGVECWGASASPLFNPTYGALPTGTGYTALSLSKYVACALTADGSIECWGSNVVQQASGAPVGNDYKSISVNREHNCAIDSASNIECWGGSNGYGQSDSPGGSGYAAVSAGLYHTCSLSEEGQIECWGSNTYDQSETKPLWVPPTSETLVYGFMPGEDVECIVSATDGTNQTTNSALVTVNTPPTASAVSIDYSGSVLSVDESPSCSYTFDDFDFDPDNSTIQWAINGTLANTGSTLTDVFFSGDVLSCTVTPNDGLEDGQPVTAFATVGNALPTASTVTISPTNPTPGDTPSCDWTYSDSDGDPELGSTVEWLVNGTMVQSDTVDTGPVTGSSVSFQTGEQITCTVTPNDGVDTGAPVSEHVGTCGGNCDPVVTNVSISPSPVTAAVGTVDCLYTYFDADNDPDASLIYWYVNGNPAFAGSSYSGSWIRGDDLMCQVNPSDGGTPLTPVETTVTVGNALPTLSDFAITPTSPTASDSIQASGTTYDADGDSVSVIYEWYVDGVLNLETGPTLAPSEFTKGQTIYAVGTPDDGVDSGIPVTSDTLTVLNTEAVVSGPSLAYINGNYVCSYDYSDADADADNSTVTWLVNGVTVSPDTYSELALGANFTCGTDASDDSIRCWGDNSAAQLNPGQATATSLTAGDQSACGLDTGGVAFCWGDDSSGQISQSPTTALDELGLGNAHGCSRKDISVSCWGDDTYSQVSGTPSGFFSEVGIGADYSCAIDSFGDLSCWGRDVAGETTPPTSSTYSDISLSSEFACALDSSGTIECWGSDADGGLSAPSGVHDQLASGSSHACALNSSGTVSCWGDDSLGQLQVPTASYSYLGSGPSADHACALNMAGELSCWGDDSSSQAPKGGTLSSGFGTGDTVSCQVLPSDGEWSGPVQSTDEFVP